MPWRGFAPRSAALGRLAYVVVFRGFVPGAFPAAPMTAAETFDAVRGLFARVKDDEVAARDWDFGKFDDFASRVFR